MRRQLRRRLWNMAMPLAPIRGPGLIAATGSTAQSLRSAMMDSTMSAEVATAFVPTMALVRFVVMAKFVRR